MIRVAPAYTTIEAVKAELPARLNAADSTYSGLPDPLPDQSIQQKIDSRANFIDAQLAQHYLLPALPLTPDPACNPSIASMNPLPQFTPTLLEQINRYFAVEECLVILRDARNDEQSNRTWFHDQAQQMLADLKAGESWLTYPFVDCTTGQLLYVPLNPNSPLYTRHPLYASGRIRYSFPEHTFTRDSWPLGVRGHNLSGDRDE